MSRTINFLKRNFKEVFRDPIIYIFCLGFPILMFLLFYVINNFSNSQTPTFETRSLLPGIITFSYSFVMLTMSLIVSKDKQTFFLKRLYSSPMKAHEYILGYAFVGLSVGFLQTIVCIFVSCLISVVDGVAFLTFGEILLLILSQIPIMITNIFLGLLFGSLFNDKSAPGITSVFISLSGILGGCWMPLETMGGFETICRCLPFYPSVYIGRVVTNATNAFGDVYVFNGVAWFGLLPIVIFMFVSILLSTVFFKKIMTSDK